jgi:phosphate:Na+ symporter
VFNVVNTLLFLGLTGPIARLVTRMAPDDEEGAQRVVGPVHLEESLLTAPALALQAARREIVRMGALAARSARESVPAILGEDARRLETVLRLDEDIDLLHGHVVEYLRRVSRPELSAGQNREVGGLFDAVNALESIGDIVETNLVPLGRQRHEKRLRFTNDTEEAVRELHRAVVETLAESLRSLEQEDVETARRVVGSKGRINELADRAAAGLRRELDTRRPGVIDVYRVGTDVVEKLKRIYYFTKRLSRGVAGGEP